MNEEEFAQILARGHEQRGIEFKGPCIRTDNHKFANIARAIMGMANHRDGGMVIIGIEDTNGQLSEHGLEASDLATWRYDDVAIALSNYTDPNVEFELEHFEFNGYMYVIIHVKEFEEIPIICKKEFNYSKDGRTTPQIITRNGACYVRTRKKPETSEIPTQTEMRELLELAVDKGIRKFMERTHNVGVDLSQVIIQSDRARFDRQIEDLIK